jgi:hypothetical protein
MSYMGKRMIFIFAVLFMTLNINAQGAQQDDRLQAKLEKFFKTYRQTGLSFDTQPQMEKYVLDNTQRTIDIYADSNFGGQPFSPAVTSYIYDRLRKILPQPYNTYTITVYANGKTIDELIPNNLTEKDDVSRQWGDIDYTGLPWVKNVSLPYTVTKGLQNRHLSVWASHGIYYNANLNKWTWQRPYLYGTTEDLFTQTIVVPYLIPMLEKAGAVVFTPRERDWQKNEVIVDNDFNTSKSYTETSRGSAWTTTQNKGFAFHSGTYKDNENPFTAGTARMASASSRRNGTATASYCPLIPEEGRYAVYVSYQTLPNSVPDAHYTVYHKGEYTSFHVNQQMGGGTWVYLGTFDFDQGDDLYNRVVVSNESDYRGVVTTDAVRFGGGMGNIERGGLLSGMPRCLEGARYYAQWAGMDYSVYSSKNGTDDYGDDINARSLMTNWLGGGSVYMPSMEGDKVPFEMSLAVHSDAGYRFSSKDLVGSLAICTTDFNDGVLNSGLSRMASRELADALLTGITYDLKKKYGKWVRRQVKDENYSETRTPEVPSVIIETMSHQNFGDMLDGQDPNFRFTLARAIYKSILRYNADMHGDDYTVQPLAPTAVYTQFTNKNMLSLHWSSTVDSLEPSAQPTGYIVYKATGHGGFDNGTYVRTRTYYNMALQPGIMYRFRVTAVNNGGESFPSEIVTAAYQPKSVGTLLIVNGFHRLSSPAVILNDSLMGFDLQSDIGVSYGKTAGWNGKQTVFDRTKLGTTLGNSGNELAGKFIAGNDFDNPVLHGAAIMSAKNYSFVSCSSEAVCNGKVELGDYPMVDMALGLEKDDGHSLIVYKALPVSLQRAISNYLKKGGRLLLSGCYIGSDMQQPEERAFMSSVLKCTYAQSDSTSENATLSGLGSTFPIYSSINEHHYAAMYPDVLKPVSPAYCTMTYPDGQSACVGYKGTDYSVMIMGFPFECIQSEGSRNSLMRGIVKYLLQ